MGAPINNKNHYKNGKPKCKNCGVQLNRWASKRCRPCFYESIREEGHWSWKGGKQKCLDCNKQLKSVYAKRCTSCAGKIKEFSARHRKNLSLVSKGKPKLWIRGKSNPAWRGGITPIEIALRKTFEYEEWRKSVFERDDYTCKVCGEIGGKLEADHIKPWSLYKELRFDLSNGQTLCESCHLVKTKEDLKRIYRQRITLMRFYKDKMKGGEQ